MRELLAKIATIADEPDEGEEARLRHHMLVYAGLLMSAGGMLWGTIACAVGLYWQSAVPYGYVLVTAVNYLVLSRSRNFPVARSVQISISLLLPFAFQWVLGGFVGSGAIMIWSMLAIVGSFALEDRGGIWKWLCAFTALTVGSGLIERHLVTPAAIDSASIRTTFFALNLVTVPSVAFLLTFYAREDALNVIGIKSKQLEASQQALVQSEKLAALGQLVAGVAHELNTPLGAIRASVGNLAGTLDTVQLLPALTASTTPEELTSFIALLRSAGAATPLPTSKEERQARRALRAQLDELGVAGSAAVADILVDVGLVRVTDDHMAALKSSRQTELVKHVFSLTALQRNGANIRLAADRAAKIVFALKSYAHPGAEDVRAPASVGQNIETVLTLYHNYIKRGVEVAGVFDEDTVIDGMHDQLNQVWTNLIHNALQAMDYRGNMVIEAERVDDGVRVRVIDSGKGIPDDIQPKIFEPFFTTKGVGEGTGLGLSICKDIVARHNGTIDVESKPGRTCFSVYLPGKPMTAGESHV